MKLPLTGIVPPLLTPLRDRDELDIAGLECLIEHVLSGGVTGLFILGTTGEGPSLSYRLRYELVERVCRQVKRRVPVLVGITDTAFVESVAVARFAAESGADAVVAAPPYYMPEGQPELQEWLDHLTEELPLPLFLYNMPPLTKVSFEPDTIRYAANNSRVIGLKDSSGDMEYFRRVAKLFPSRTDWSLFMGPEELLADAIDAGAHGGVCGGANVFPHLYVELCDAAQKKKSARVRELQAMVSRVRKTFYTIGRHPSSIIKGIKCAASCLGICDDFMAEPFHRFRAEQRARVERGLEEIESDLEKLGLNKLAVRAGK